MVTAIKQDSIHNDYDSKARYSFKISVDTAIDRINYGIYDDTCKKNAQNNKELG